jgi:probable F420-dependent oxidoreductase
MQLGCFIPQMGVGATPEGMVKAAQSAEKLGFDSVWVTERLLFPVNPRNPYVAEPDGKLPDAYKRVFDPIQALTWVAAHTKKIRVGTSVLDIPFYNPIVLGRTLTSLDVLSGGRLTVGLGLGWSEDEYEATAAHAKHRGVRADEFLQVLHAMWKDNPAEFSGKFFTLPRSYFDLRPAQKPHPPIYLAAYAPAAMKRVAQYADGWMPVGLPMPAINQMWAGIQQMAKEAGRKPGELKLSVRGNLHLTDKPAGEGRWPFHGNRDEIKQDVAAVRGLGADELVLDVTFSPGVKTADDFLKANEQARELLG